MQNEQLQFKVEKANKIGKERLEGQNSTQQTEGN